MCSVALSGAGRSCDCVFIAVGMQRCEAHRRRPVFFAVCYGIEHDFIRLPGNKRQSKLACKVVVIYPHIWLNVVSGFILGCNKLIAAVIYTNTHLCRMRFSVVDEFTVQTCVSLSDLRDRRAFP